MTRNADKEKGGKEEEERGREGSGGQTEGRTGKEDTKIGKEGRMGGIVKDVETRKEEENKGRE